jgi:hypothetical protein
MNTTVDGCVAVTRKDFIFIFIVMNTTKTATATATTNY